MPAQKGSDKIAVEIKRFVAATDLEDLYQADDQFILYRKALRIAAPEHTLCLAIKKEGIRNTSVLPASTYFRTKRKIPMTSDALP
jgi:XisH protein